MRKAQGVQGQGLCGERLLHRAEVSGYWTRGTGVCGHQGRCQPNGRYFYRTLYGHHRHACRLSNPRGQQAGHRPSCAMRRDRDVGRKSRARYHVQHPDNIGITRTPVCSRGAAVPDAMAKAHALAFVRHSVTRHARSRAGLAAPCCPAIPGAPTGVLV
jgi:hypothetical protein